MQCQCLYLPTVQSSSQAKSKKSYSLDNVNYLTLLLHCKPWLVPYLVVAHLPRTRTLGVGLWEVKITLRQFSTNQCAHLNRNVYNKQLLEMSLFCSPPNIIVLNPGFVICVVLQFYPLSNFYFSLFHLHFHIPQFSKNKGKLKLNHNIHLISIK